MSLWVTQLLHTVNSTLLSAYFAFIAAAPDATLAFDRRLWNVSRLLSAAIYIAIAATVVFICYMVFRHRKK